MKGLRWIHLVSIAALVGSIAVTAPLDDLDLLGDAVKGVVHLPISRRVLKSRLRKRDGFRQNAQIGLGDVDDISYSVQLEIGSVLSSFYLDTGSSDLWAVADTYVGDRKSQAPLYSTKSFQSLGIDFSLQFGDSSTMTFVDGVIGKDTVSIAGITVHDQYLAAINHTNTTVFGSGDIGMLGLGFFSSSEISQRSFRPSQLNSPPKASTVKRRSVLSANPRLLGYTTHFLRRSLLSSFGHSSQLKSKRQPASRTNSETTSSFLKSLPTVGNLFTRLILSKTLASPQFTLTLQRDKIQVGGNAGLLTLGGLPSGVKSDSLTWVPVRLHSEAEGGLAGPVEAPSEVRQKYPRHWEISIDDVYLNGQKLPRSSLVPSNMSIFALIDTGNSMIRGPPDVMKLIDDTIGVLFPCSSAHTLAFKIEGKMFPIDARDFVLAEHDNSAKMCTTPIAPTDVPQEGDGNLFTWSLGDPFLKSVLASFYFGDLNTPSRDPPQIGFLSTVPSDDGKQLRAAVSSATSRETGFSVKSERAPTGVPTATQTNTAGVLQASGV